MTAIRPLGSFQLCKKLLVTGFAFLILSNPVFAASLSISGPADTDAGNTFQLQIHGNFDPDGLIAGGITFNWDASLVQLGSITRAFGLQDFSCPGSANCPPVGSGSAPIVWGEFLTDLIPAGNEGTVLMATLEFTALAAGDALFSMEDNLDLTGGWFGAGFSPIDSPTYGELSVAIPDTDQDSIADSEDNCLLEPNPQQRDTDGDGIGNLCDPDISPINDCVVDFADLLQLELGFFLIGDFDTDLNGDGLTNMGDVGIMRQYFFGPPGPSGLPNSCE